MQRPESFFAFAHEKMNLHILRVFEGTFSLEAGLIRVHFMLIVKVQLFLNGQLEIKALYISNANIVS